MATVATDGASGGAGTRQQQQHGSKGSDDSDTDVVCETVMLADVGDVVVISMTPGTAGDGHSSAAALATIVSVDSPALTASPAPGKSRRSSVPAPSAEDDALLEKEMRALLASVQCDRFKLQQLCAAHGNRIPPSCRRRAWAVLLGVEALLHVRDGLLHQALETTPEDLSNQRVVMADVSRACVCACARAVRRRARVRAGVSGCLSCLTVCLAVCLSARLPA